MVICKGQIENEYGPIEWEIHAPGKAYAKWAAEMAVGLGTGVPWIMCKQDDAPDQIVSISRSFVFFFCFLFLLGLLNMMFPKWETSKQDSSGIVFHPICL